MCVLDPSVLERLGIGVGAEVDVSVEGERIVLTPRRAARAERLEGAVARVLADHDDTFRKLAR